MCYYDWLDYKDMKENLDNYFKKKKVANFEIIYHEKRVTFRKEKTVSALIKNIKRDDLWLQRDILIEYCKNFK